MTDFDVIVAALNDNIELNNRRVVGLLVDLLREVEPRGSSYVQYLDQIGEFSRDDGYEHAETAERVIDELNNSNISKYRDYLDRLTQHNYQFYNLFNPEYPRSLWSLEDPPLALYKQGNAQLSDSNIAIVGTRDATDERIEFAFEMAKHLAEEGHTIVSGLALGVDTAAHEGCLEANGETLAILPADIDNVHPKSNRSLAEKITKSGALVSERSQFAKMHNGRYIERNRITSGISNAIIVAASREEGGTIEQSKIAQGQQIPRFYFKPNNYDKQSPSKLRDLGFKSFANIDELDDLLSRKSELFKTKSPSRKTLSEF